MMVEGACCFVLLEEGMREWHGHQHKALQTSGWTWLEAKHWMSLTPFSYPFLPSVAHIVC